MVPVSLAMGMAAEGTGQKQPHVPPCPYLEWIRQEGYFGVHLLSWRPPTPTFQLRGC